MRNQSANARQLLVLLGGVIIAYACAPRNRAAADEPPRKTSHSTAAVVAPDTASFALSVTHDKPRTVAFAIAFTNKRKSLEEVRFRSGRTHDFVVLDDADREVWRWSEGRLFTQAMQTRQLKTGDAVTFAATWNTATPGHYRVVASLNAASHAEPVEREFVVR